MSTVANIRRGLLREVKALLEPHLWNSGYSKPLNPKQGIFGEKRPLRVWLPADKKGKVTFRDWPIGGLVIEELQGFTEDGVIVDAAGGGLVTAYWRGIPTEDLALLVRWLKKHLPKAQKKAEAAA